MAKINLLPWRETERKEKQQEFFVMLGAGAAIAALAVLLVHFQVENMIDGQERRNAYLKNEIVILDEKIKEIQKLDATQTSANRTYGSYSKFTSNSPWHSSLI